ncbi:hypothetical protein GGQ74_001293 [Desulfobaculum xiamenense]|uniref:Uncharacterized protein n=1 Tax=Desulfobaculum xiamenense TaxID=995050 RepID=A0A846QN21_9BACT|nr:hypothetical protein [Desulfobaculum xiamenense]NJB67653.1 hypothetical protein [Desulfobaculum xiamenense]
MMLPQDEAKLRTCPFLTSSDGKFRFCLGAQCMMWRFRYSDRQGEEDEGYCGVAGKPAGAM